jgi:hypothetical protein
MPSLDNIEVCKNFREPPGGDDDIELLAPLWRLCALTPEEEARCPYRAYCPRMIKGDDTTENYIAS